MAPTDTTSPHAAEGEIQFEEDVQQHIITRTFNQIVQQHRATNSDAQGIPFSTIGADSYQEYLTRVRDVSDGVADPGLPVDATDVDIQYPDPDMYDHVRWQGLQEGRESFCTLVLQDFGCRDWLHYTVNDPLLENDMTPEWRARHCYQLTRIR